MRKLSYLFTEKWIYLNINQFRHILVIKTVKGIIILEKNEQHTFVNRLGLTQLMNEIAEVFLDEVPGMVEAFGNDAKRSHLLPSTTEHGVSPPQSGTIHF